MQAAGYLVVVVPLLVPSQPMTVQDLYLSTNTWGRDIQTQVLFKLELSQVTETKLLQEHVVTVGVRGQLEEFKPDCQLVRDKYTHQPLTLLFHPMCPGTF